MSNLSPEAIEAVFAEHGHHDAHGDANDYVKVYSMTAQRIARAIIEAHETQRQAEPAAALRIIKGGRDGNWQEFDVSGHGGLIRVVARMENHDEDLPLGQLVERLLLTALPPAHVPSAWISVDDRLPEKFEEVMMWPRPTDYCMTGRLEAERWSYFDHDNYGSQTVSTRAPTHWMPLPTAPAKPAPAADACPGTPDKP